jgi:type IV secretion system protein VirB7
MKLSKIITAFLVSCLLAGCTTAGPYVTNISSDGAYGLNIEKCKVELNAFLGVVNTGDCTSSSLKLNYPSR